MTFRRITKCGVFSSIIFFSIFTFCNFGNAQQYIGPYGSLYGFGGGFVGPIGITGYDPSFMPPYYGPTPGGVTFPTIFGGLSGYSPEFDMSRGPVPGDFFTSYPGGWGFSPNWGNRWLLGSAGMYGPGGLYLYDGYGSSLYGGWLW